MIKAIIFDLFETLITERVSDKYTSRKCANDLGVDYSLFREYWEANHHLMFTGLCSYEQVLEIICKQAGVALTAEKLSAIIKRRKETKRQCFEYRHIEILNMLKELKAMGYQLALCSNCFSLEAEAYRKSELPHYFDASVLSWETGYAKPDSEIYRQCVDNLQLLPQECLYIGDGGSRELYGAEAFGMKPLRAMWFIDKYSGKYDEMPFKQVHNPLEVIKICEV